MMQGLFDIKYHMLKTTNAVKLEIHFPGIDTFSLI